MHNLLLSGNLQFSIGTYEKQEETDDRPDKQEQMRIIHSCPVFEFTGRQKCSEGFGWEWLSHDVAKPEPESSRKAMKRRQHCIQS